MASIAETTELYTASLPERHNPPPYATAPVSQQGGRPKSELFLVSDPPKEQHPSLVEQEDSHSDLTPPHSSGGSPKYELQATTYPASYSTGETLNNKPIVVPQSTNLFFIKTFSPFTRCYSPALAKLDHPIGPEEFLTFIDRLNQVFISNPIFQAAHVAGGMLMGSQVLPAMAVGAVFQFGSLAASAGVSFVRCRKFMKAANATIFAPRGLVCKIQTTKKMMAQVGFTATDAKGNLVLAPLEDNDDLGEYNPVVAAQEEAKNVKKEKPLERDPRLMRLKALEGYIAPLEFEDAHIPASEGKLSRMGQAPIRWMNRKQMRNLDTAKAKSVKQRGKMSAKIEAQEARAASNIAELDRRMDGMTDEERALLEVEKKLEMGRRDAAIDKIHEKTDKKMGKAFKKEGKVANRILWIVIDKADGTDGGNLFEVGTEEV